MKKFGKIILAAALALAALSPLSAKGKTGRTVAEIKKSKVIKIAVFSDKKPFGYVDENGDVIFFILSRFVLTEEAAEETGFVPFRITLEEIDDEM